MGTSRVPRAPGGMVGLGDPGAGQDACPPSASHPRACGATAGNLKDLMSAAQLSGNVPRTVNIWSDRERSMCPENLYYAILYCCPVRYCTELYAVMLQAT
jgi:hypothetical protein